MTRKALAFFLSVVLVAANSPLGWAVQHVKPGAYPHPFQDMIHHPSAAQMRAAGTLQAALKSGSTGPKTVAVIVVQFPSSSCGGCTSGSNSITSPSGLANINSYFTKMASYYDEVSYHTISLTFKFFGPNDASVTGDALPGGAVTAGAFTLTHTMEYYGCGDEGVGCSGVTTPTTPGVGANGDYLTRDAIDAARNGGHTGLLSTNVAGGTFDAVIVVHAGNGNETTQNTNGDIWSIFYSQDTVIAGTGPVDATAAAAGFTEGDVVPETETSGIISPLGVMCHEFGHSLGLPDLYNTTAIGGSSVNGRWEIMDSGPYDGAGANPSHPGAWDKQFLGWVTPTVITTKTSASLNYIENIPSLLKLPVQNAPATEYFLVEYRSPSSGATYDTGIPGAGLLVWHIDDAITAARGLNASAPNIPNTVNTGSPHYGVAIVSRDGISVGSTGGTANNTFGNNQNFSGFAAYNFNGQPSGINILNISKVGTGTASMFIENLQSAGSQSIVKLINYPNPAGKGYPHPMGEGHTTIQLQLAKVPTDLQINIYTLSGDLVRKAGTSEIIDNPRSDDTDFRFVYEYVWDLKNGDGKMVAPGVYLVLARADGQSKSNKIVVIR
jgi:M6 family metalloprotease-like protein